MEKQLLCLMKIGEKKYMEDFCNMGCMYLQRWKVYKGIEDNERGDVNEGLSHSLQPNKVVLSVNGININQEDVIGPIRISKEGFDPLIYCMYAFNSDHIKLERGKVLDRRCYKFGNTAVVITNGQEFYNRIREACNKYNFGCVGNFIEYVDYESYHGEMGCFRKYKEKFSHQHEFRFKFDTNISDKVYKLYIGSIKDISIVCPVCEINSQLKIITEAV